MAILLIPVSIILLYLQAELRSQFRREGMGYGNNLIGRDMPKISGINCRSGVVQLIDHFRNEIHAIVAVSPGCGSCENLVKELSAASSTDLAGVRLIVICMGKPEGCKTKLEALRSIPAYIVSDRDDENTDLWLAGFPATLIVDEKGKVMDLRHPISVKGLVAAFANSSAKTNRPVSKSSDPSTIGTSIG